MAEVEHNEESLLFLEACAEYKREPTAAAAAALTDKYGTRLGRTQGASRTRSPAAHAASPPSTGTSARARRCR